MAMTHIATEVDATAVAGIDRLTRSLDRSRDMTIFYAVQNPIEADAAENAFLREDIGSACREPMIPYHNAVAGMEAMTAGHLDRCPI